MCCSVKLQQAANVVSNSTFGTDVCSIDLNYGIPKCQTTNQTGIAHFLTRQLTVSDGLNMIMCKCIFLDVSSWLLQSVILGFPVYLP